MAQFADPARAPAKKAARSWPAARPQAKPRGPCPAQLRSAAKPAPASSEAPGRSRLPAGLRAGVEALSGLAMGDVRVHRNSPEPAKLGALAYTKGADIHLGPGQDQHLPHKAWHAVQQKQGRVKATAQMKGLAVNEDSGLEEEADRMAPALSQSAGRHAPALRSKTIHADTIQRKVEWRGTLLEPPSGGAPAYSAVTLAHIARPESFLMTDDVSPTDKVIHVIDAAKKYLLAEEHGSGTWETNTAPWSIDRMTEADKVTEVDKMTELERVIPHEPDDAAGAFDEPVVPARQPLESSHEYLLTMVIWAQTRFNDLCSDRRKKGWKGQRADIKTAISETLSLLGTILRVYPKYLTFISTYEARKIDGSASLKRIYEFSIAYRDTYKRASRELRLLLQALDYALDHPERFEKRENGRLSIAGHFDLLDTDRVFLPTMGAGLATLIRGLTKAEEGKIGKALAKDTAKFSHRENAIVDPIRERTMVANIARAAPPLLVQLGKDHAPRVHAKLKPATVLVPAKTPFAKITRRP